MATKSSRKKNCPGQKQPWAGKSKRKKPKRATIAYGILKAHNQNGDMDNLKIRFDALTSHDITYVGIIQTAKAPAWKISPCPTSSPAATTPCAP